MDIRSGECCIARYAGSVSGSGSGGAYDNNSNKIDRIMLRFRPIAPKPVSSSTGSGGSSPDKNEAYLKTSRVKRKYVRDQNKRYGGGNSRRKRRVVSEVRKDELMVYDQTVVTLPLLPETPDDDKKAAGTTNISSSSPSPTWSSDLEPTVKSRPLLPVWLNSNHRMLTAVDLNVLTPQPVRPVGSCVIVEGSTDSCRGEVGEMLLGFTDVEKKTNLEKDTCPAFISDGFNRVKWTNEAYRKMVNQDDIHRDYENSRPEMVWLVMKEKITTNEVAAFACKVRLQYTCCKEKNTLMVPCDVWKMEGGGFAWRLDVKVALSLGR
ncbi:von willebrand factor A domain protein [Thalictrum thalictroides]|uniref:von willebrand factor A domain protein n=1 Tax=Thalictrum thalictroides TaxID=46969 RepID=A0A7J6W238_THATH|nr:von willebrand factor A domain protein [Thalictrum thalictroides]